MMYVPKPVPEGVNVAPTNHLAELVTLLGALALLAVAAFYGLGWTADQIALRMSPDLEARLSARLGLHRLPTSSATAEDAMLQRLTAGLPPERFPLRLQLVCDSTAVNAMAIPGGHVVVLRGLLDTVGSENELAFVLAHEVGHFANRDHLRAFGRALVWMTVATLLGGQGDFSGNVIRDSGFVASRRFSQRQELEADRFAADLVAATYGHAGGMTDFFHNPAIQDGGGWVATHPASRRRVRALERLIAERGWSTGPVTPYRSTACVAPAS
jgi:Zn-dependent protease with chaperone function